MKSEKTVSLSDAGTREQSVEILNLGLLSLAVGTGVQAPPAASISCTSRPTLQHCTQTVLKAAGLHNPITHHICVSNHPKSTIFVHP
ncbi:MAG: hypothetical protein ACXWGW_08690 [Methylobacter sp.]